MTGNRTLAIIKPDAFGAGKAGKIVAHLEALGFRIICARVLHMSKAEAGAFYEVHQGRPFYGELVEFMSSGPCMPLVLEKTDAVAAYRAAIGATDPAEAAAGTVRKLFAESKGRNAVHGSDSDDNARQEGLFFFGAAALI
jgi:nucleoside-diphosphate kinase